MPQHDMDIANQAFAATRVDINAALQALVSQNSGPTAPPTIFAYQLWADTTTGILKQRNAANSAWINLLALASGVPSAATSAKTDTTQTYTAAQRGGVVTLTDGSTITPDFAAANNFTVTLGGNRTLANPTNAVAGQSGVIRVIQDATGSRTLAYGNAWDWAGGAVQSLTTTANAVDLLAYYVDATGNITLRLIADRK
ncbi:hypothetical protein [Rhodoferax aquaticus]|uniref:Uncharacterized protein n=1 Tax=Rhodoferax aquaticus TaxID=2527691 RepID=A0A515ERL6_9BURK|nr:hypothetical protein [Rhodoferax aquaticus]QDL55295.1 hypothetical protein EXZ61_14590 [Rhodoferax aquaticus]